MSKTTLAKLLGAALLIATTLPTMATAQPGWSQHDDRAKGDGPQKEWHDRKGDYDQRNDPYRRSDARHEEYRHEEYRHDDYRNGNYRHGPVNAYDANGRYRDPRPLDRDDHIWRGRDGRYHCRRDNGTEGLIIGGAVGALVGRSLDNGRDRTVGTLLGAAGGALLGQSIDRGTLRCR